MVLNPLMRKPLELAQHQKNEGLDRLAALLLELNPKTPEEAQRLKIILAKELQLKKIPSNTEILSTISGENREKLSTLLRKKLVKTISGVAVITVVAPVYACPHGRCIYCPGGIVEGTPQSYTGNEEAVKAALRVMYDPYMQVRQKIKQLREMGHPVDKVELIIIGGTFTAMPLEFQRTFIKRCLDALNEYDSPDLDTALEYAEKAPIRVSGMLIETKPDWGKAEHGNIMLEMGVTRVELGVQALDDEIYRITNRGHTLDDVIQATADLKDLAFKVGYHIMPNLPGSTLEKDYEMFKQLFADDRFRPDHLKIYPTLVLPRTGLYKLWREGKYTPYSDEELIKLLARCLANVPRYVRVQRIQREIPLSTTVDGNKIPNLRQAVEEYMEKQGMKCECIRCREIGHKMRREKFTPDYSRTALNRIYYEASGGVECFISIDETKHDALIGFIRVRIPSRTLRPELKRAALVRELHVYGHLTPVGMKPDLFSQQHRGYGRQLLAEAERIAREEFSMRKLVVISGVGVREYYYKNGYRRDGPYVSKLL